MRPTLLTAIAAAGFLSSSAFAQPAAEAPRADNPPVAPQVDADDGVPPQQAPGAPISVRGVVQKKRTINGIPYATISLGSADDVKEGMKFVVVDRDRFLCFLTILNVEENESVGQLEGPNVGRVAPGSQVLNPAAPDVQQIPPQVADVNLVKATYLGIATSPAPKSLRHQVELPEGVGLVVEVVAPDSPAADAGLQQHDLLHKLDDQILVNAQQLAVLVRTHKPGDTVKLTVIRAGKPTELSAKLIEREVPPLDEMRLNVEPRDLEFRGPLMNDALVVPPGNAGVMPHPPMHGLLSDNFTVRWNDGTLDMTVTCRNGRQTLVARDPKTGQALFSGPIDTPEQRDALPPPIRERMKNVMVQGLDKKPHTRPTTDPAKDQPSPTPKADPDKE